MENIKLEVRGTKLLIEVDLAQSVDKTGSGNVMVATTGNWHKLRELGVGWSVNMVVVRKPESPIPVASNLRAVG